MGCADPSSQESSQTSRTQSQVELLNDAIAIYRDTLGQQAEQFPGDRVSPLSTLQQGAIEGAGDIGQIFSQPQTAGTPLFGETGEALTGALAGTTGATPFTEQDTADFFGRAIQEPTLRNFQQNVVPDIESAFAGPGFFGAARSQELSQASQDVNATLGAQRAALEFDVLGRNQALQEASADRSLAAVPSSLAFGQVPAQEIRNNLEIASSQLGGLNQVFGFGQAEQTQAQRLLEDEILRFAEANQITDPQNLAIVLSLLGLNFGSAEAQGQGAGLGFSVLTGAAGGPAGGALTSALIASDEKVKENIKPFNGNAAEILRKLKPKTYNYLGSKEPRLGLVAQDVEKVYPRAVVDIDGVKHVDTYAIQTLIIQAMQEMEADNG